MIYGNNGHVILWLKIIIWSDNGANDYFSSKANITANYFY